MYTNEFSKNLLPFLQKIKTSSLEPDDKDYPIHCFLKDNDVEIDPTGSEICDFLKGKSIFITGGTGFLGKLLVEKLLRACIDIDSMFLLVREKKSKAQNTRVSELLDDVVFDKLASIHPNFKSRVHVIHGDVGSPGLGISGFDRKMLTEKIDIIFHVAATTRFDEHLRLAVAININGTREMIKLAKECKRLVSFVHVSTAYSNCNRYYIEEKIYEPHIEADELISIARSLSQETLQEITPNLLGGLPNTYTLTKQIAESVIEAEGKNLPICIYRPAIVVATLKEPLRSWTDNIFGPVGLIAGASVGLIKVLPGSVNNRGDIMPADYVINACIACSYKITENANHNEIPVYNFTNDKENAVTWGMLHSKEVFRVGERIGTTKIMRFPGVRFVPQLMLYIVLNALYHKCFAYVTDAVMYATGKEPRLVKVYQKVEKFANALSYFTRNEFDFETKNMNKLWDTLNSQDKNAFPFDMKNLDWNKYFLTLFTGLRVYLLKENLDNLEEGRLKMKRAYYIQLTVNAIIIGFLLLVSYKLLLFFFLYSRYLINQ